MKIILTNTIKLQIILLILTFLDSILLLLWGINSDTQVSIVLGLFLLIVTFVIILNQIPKIFVFDGKNRDLFIIGLVFTAYFVAFAIIIISSEFPTEYYYPLLIGVVVIICIIIGSVIKIIKNKDSSIYYDERYQLYYNKSQAMAGIIALLALVQLVVIEQIFVISIPSYSSLFVIFGAWGTTIAASQFYYKHWG